ncbi:hypothetical protein [Streptomyces coelicoflavus]|uniref:hypothetical protein n=1 Tax=Streptomyces coelicoflavus TaxID=285562 RepID=UPI003626527E
MQLPVVLEAGESLEPWPAQSAIAQSLGISQPTVSQNLQVAFDQWAELPWLGRIRDELVAVLADRDRVSTAEELASELRARHGAGADDADETQAVAGCGAGRGRDGDPQTGRGAVRPRR